MSYVTGDGPRFLLDGERFRFIGLNYYQLIQDHYTMVQLDNFFDYVARAGFKVVRTFCFNRIGPSADSTGYFEYKSGSSIVQREATYVDLDNVLDSAMRHGIKMILPISDNFPEFNDWACKQERCYWANTIYGTSYDRHDKGDDFYLDSHIKQWYKDRVDFMAARINTVNGRTYADDDTIMTLEMGNELRMTTGTDTSSGTLSSYRLGVLTSWYTEMSAYIKSQFPNHLVGTGSQAQFYDFSTNDPKHNGTFYGGDYTTQHAISDIDYYDFHMYAYEDYDVSSNPVPPLRAYGQKKGFPNTPTRRGFLWQLYEYCKTAKDNNKPCVIGEYGIDKRVTTKVEFDAYPRDEHFKQLFREIFDTNYDIDGIMLWSGGTLDDNINYAIKLDGVHTSSNDPSNLNTDDTNLISIINQQSYKANGKRIPISVVNGVEL